MKLKAPVLFGILIVVVGMVVGLVVVKNWYSTLGWTNYTNSKYGYSFKYPSSFYLDKELELGPSFRLTKNKDVKDPTKRVYEVELAVIVSENSDLDKQISGIQNRASIKQITINGAKGYRVENIVEGNPLGNISTFIGRDNSIFSLILFTPTKDKELISIYDKMVSTFKFTNLTNLDTVPKN